MIDRDFWARRHLVPDRIGLLLVGLMHSPILQLARAADVRLRVARFRGHRIFRPRVRGDLHLSFAKIVRAAARLCDMLLDLHGAYVVTA